MKRALGCLLVAPLAGLLLGGLTVRAAAQTEELLIVEAIVDKRDVDVTLVAPPDLRGIDLDADSFTVSVGGVSVVPTVEQIRGDELDVVLLVDVSGSMTEAALEAAKASGRTFIDQLPPSTRISVVSFGSSPTVVQPFTENFDDAIRALDSLLAQGETALYAAVVEAAAQFDPTIESIRTVVLLSDGGNTVDASSLGAAQAALIGSEATLHAISIETEEANPAELEALADASGGSVARVEQVEAIEALYSEIAADLVNQYQLAFVAPGEGPTLALVQVRDGAGSVVAEAVIGLQLPVLEPPVEEASPPVPAPTPAPAPTPTPQRRTATAPAVVTIDASDATWLKWTGIGSTAGALVIIGLLFAIPARRSRGVKPIERFSAGSRPNAGGGVRWFSDMLTTRIERLLSGRRFGAWLSNLLDTAGWKLRNSEFVVLVGLIAVVAFFAGAIRSLALGLSLGFLVVATVALLLLLLVKQRRDAFAGQLNATLQMMAGGLRTGYSLPQVISMVADEAKEPTSEEFGRIVVESRLGRDLIESTSAVADRMKSEDFEWATAAMDVSRDVGGDLAEVLDNVAGTIRTRARVRRQIRALSAEGRVSAWILIALPFPIFFWQLLVNREYTMLLFNTSMGRIIFIVAVSALISGAIWMRKLIQVEY